MDAATQAQAVEALTGKLKTLGIDELPAEPNTYPALNPFDLYRSHVAELLSKSTGIDTKIICPALQRTVKTEHGDLQMAVAALRQKRKDMKEFAQEIANGFPGSPLIEKVVVMDALLMFWFKAQPLTSLVVPAVLKFGKSYGFNNFQGLRDPADPSKGRKKMIVEFSSPNIAKPFHAGHLRSTIIGGFLANLYDAGGWDVTRMNYLGDWGKQYGVLAIGFDLFGSEEKLVENPIGHLYDVYVKISKIQKDEEEKMKELKAKIEGLKKEEKDTSELEKQLQEVADNGVDEGARKYFKRMTEGEPVALGIWKRFRDLSIEKYKRTYARLNIRYDDYSGESQVKDESMDHAAKVMEEMKVSENSEGAIIVDLTKYSKKLGKAVVRKKDGTSLYLTRDIAAVSERYEKYKFDKMIYVVASQQDLHLAQLFKILEAMGYKDLAAACTHINFGMVLGMSTRKGTAKFLDDILETVAEKMHEVMRTNQAKYEQVDNPEATADILGISAVMVQDMKGKRINNYTFDMDRMTSFEGDTGPYLQYAHARLCSITRKVTAAVPEIANIDLASAADLTLITETQGIDLVRQLAAWPDIFINTLKTQEPTTVLTYLFKLTHALSSSYDHLQILGSERETMLARLALYTAARQTLNNGMRILGLSPVERM
ncbi:arginyl-tRNA synthetase [Paraphaeosphaeria sporulosa]|uniref:arginine--tRNA ligase n=1 Tax=Paraphaeosphaeria sporulosa TaxID=1460663 RepID=A0A177C8F1_9PLEO|nr:arginyl-tRNA synthetase [Paraphaeosphaeria sporulosa]OAG02980.1 arginyl-tRNA synthetase [Paraphaeosphaeria sporulosa]